MAFMRAMSALTKPAQLGTRLHAGSKPAHKLRYHFGDRALVSDTALDTFGDEFRFGFG